MAQKVTKLKTATAADVHPDLLWRRHGQVRELWNSGNDISAPSKSPLGYPILFPRPPVNVAEKELPRDGGKLLVIQ